MKEALIYLIFLLVGYLMGCKTHKVETDTPKKVELPNLNPIQAYKEHKAKKEEEKELKKIETILENIDNYDGTGNGQKKVPM